MRKLRWTTTAACAVFACQPVMAQTALCPTISRIVTAASTEPVWHGVASGGEGVATPEGFADCKTFDYYTAESYVCDMTGVTNLNAGPMFNEARDRMTACFGSEAEYSRRDGRTELSWERGSGVEVRLTRRATDEGITIQLMVVADYL